MPPPSQTSPRGALSTGDIYVQRPGKARFAYDPQFGLLVVADGKTITVYDSRLKAFNRAPLNATPLSMLLSHEVRLDRDEDHFVRKISHLLHVPNTECMLARARARGKN